MNAFSGSKRLLSPLFDYLEDSDITEIMLNRPKELWYEKCGIFFQVDMPCLTETTLYRLCALLASEAGQVIHPARPTLSTNLYNGDRIFMCMPPMSLTPIFSIRRLHANQVKTKLLSDFIYTACEDPGISEQIPSHKIDELISNAILEKKNIVISGGTSTGKTTFLNSCLSLIPSTERIVLLEDTREIRLSHSNAISLTTILGDVPSESVDMQYLLQCTLRLRPDRIIMGEIRGKEIMDFIAACSTGHRGAMTTLHANSAKEAFQRMAQLYKLNNIPAMTEIEIVTELRSVIDLVVQLEKTTAGRRIADAFDCRA